MGTTQGCEDQEAGISGGHLQGWLHHRYPNALLKLTHPNSEPYITPQNALPSVFPIWEDDSIIHSVTQAPNLQVILDFALPSCIPSPNSVHSALKIYTISAHLLSPSLWPFQSKPSALLTSFTTSTPTSAVYSPYCSQGKVLSMSDHDTPCSKSPLVSFSIKKQTQIPNALWNLVLAHLSNFLSSTLFPSLILTTLAFHLCL